MLFLLSHGGASYMVYITEMHINLQFNTISLVDGADT